MVGYAGSSERDIPGGVTLWAGGGGRGAAVALVRTASGEVCGPVTLTPGPDQLTPAPTPSLVSRSCDFTGFIRT